jgi:hypothetical protein
MSKIDKLYAATGELRDLVAKIEKLLPQARKEAPEGDRKHLKVAALYFEELLRDDQNTRLADAINDLVGRCEKTNNNTEGMKP